MPKWYQATIKSLRGLSHLLLKWSRQAREEMSAEHRTGGDARWLSTTQAENVSACWPHTDTVWLLNTVFRYLFTVFSTTQAVSAYGSCRRNCPTFLHSLIFANCLRTFISSNSCQRGQKGVPSSFAETLHKLMRLVEVSLAQVRGSAGRQALIKQCGPGKPRANRVTNTQMRWRVSPLTAGFFSSRLSSSRCLIH